MDQFLAFLLDNLFHILYLGITALVSFITFKLKKVITKYYNEETTKNVVNTVVNACEQLYKNGEDKYMIAKNNIEEILKSKKIELSEIEIKMMIESICNTLGDKNEK